MAVLARELPPKLREWTELGLIGHEQAVAIEAHETHAQGASAGSGRRRMPALGEALGYLGAALVAVAGAILLAEYWDRLRYGARLGLVALITALMLSVGMFLRRTEEPAADRLVGFTWALAVGGAAWFVGLIVGRDGFGLQPAPMATAISSGAAALGLALWWLRPRWQQHLVAFAAFGATVLSVLSLPAVAPDPFFYGMAIVAYGLVWLLLGEAEIVRPPAVAWWLGLLAILGGLRVAPSDGYVGLGLVVAMVATAGLLTAGVVTGRSLLAGSGAVAVFLFVPQAVFHFFGDTVGAPAALLLIGLVLLGAALVVVRSQREPDQPGAP